MRVLLELWSHKTVLFLNRQDSFMRLILQNINKAKLILALAPDYTNPIIIISYLRNSILIALKPYVV